MENILSGNRLIAEFMGLSLKVISGVNYPNGKEEWLINLPGMQEFQDYGTRDYVIERMKLKYHTSWGWLMPACKKFDELPDEFTGLNARAYYECHCDSIDQSLMLYDIEMTWQELVYAITWYNSLKQ